MIKVGKAFDLDVEVCEVVGTVDCEDPFDADWDAELVVEFPFVEANAIVLRTLAGTLIRKRPCPPTEFSMASLAYNGVHSRRLVFIRPF